tara:strand:+ start:1976 stop:2491 length:516 start_codon:yes stop_codon:yes gene_type:complete
VYNILSETSSCKLYCSQKEDEMSQHHRVFIYGTLMNGLRNHHKMACAKFLSTSKTMLPSYTLLQFPSQSSPGHVTPGLKKHGNDCISGELYLLDDECLAILDDFEDVGREYERSRIMLHDNSYAWAYFLLAEKPQCAEGTPSFIVRDEATQSVSWDGHAEEAYARKALKAA